MTRQAFYDAVTPGLFRGSLPPSQKDPLDRLIDEGLARERTLYEAAYVLATAYHETDRFRAMEEYGRGEGRPYGQDVLLYSGRSVRFHGRGFVHLTWLGNYVWASAATGVDLVSSPDRAKEPAISAKIIWEGMIQGAFTGKGLADYRTGDGKLDYVQARRVVNGTDKADLVAGYAEQFEAGLMLIEDAPIVSGCPLGRADCPRAA
ncbi:hypothetical protein [Pikeienuella sp. HZG-20]|uniref:hypothetical protein n=1 Tax=Paludibacillus litoralis TaxID=3133267 RepID=UPI0030EBD1AC